jgi:hypothetical protein
MTRKDYRAIADAMNTLRKHSVLRSNPSQYSDRFIDVPAYVDKTIHELCDVFAADNPQFDRGRFFAACTLDRP